LLSPLAMAEWIEMNQLLSVESSIVVSASDGGVD